jgi:hypothetical protein
MVVRRIVAPPALPLVVGPITADRPEHVAAHDRRPKAFLTRSGETIINTFITALFAEDLVERASADEPVVELLSANTKGVRRDFD